MMRTRELGMAAAVLALCGLTAVFLVRLQAAQRLGNPGLKVVAEPIFDETGRIRGTNSAYLPPRVLGMTSTNLPVTDLELGWLPPDTTYGRRYYTASNQPPFTLSVVLMGSDRTSIHKPEYCLDGQGWKIDRTEKAVVRIPQPHPYDLEVMKLNITRVGRAGANPDDAWRGIYVYWFVADGQLTADHGQRMWWLARDLVQRQLLQRWAYVTCFTICRAGQETATFERMKDFLAAAVPDFQLVAGDVTRN